MILYDEKRNKVNISKVNKIGSRTHGSVYKLSEKECLKVYKKNVEIDIEILKTIKNYIYEIIIE